MKTLTFYALIDKESPDKFYTICENKNQIQEFLESFLVVKHFDHFTSWCTIHDENKDNKSAWSKYFKLCIGNDEIRQFSIKKIKYSIANIASILRMFCGCPPLGCSFESQLEYDYMVNKLNLQERNQKLRDQIDSFTEEMKKEIEEKIKEKEDVSQ